jgi:hypothetical protein
LAFVWSEEAVERLKALHGQGLSGAELASRLGGGLTRSAVFGKLHRLGLTGKSERERRPSPLRICDETILAPCDRGQDDHSEADHGIGPMKFNFARKGRPGRCANAATQPSVPPIPVENPPVRLA